MKAWSQVGRLQVTDNGGWMRVVVVRLVLEKHFSSAYILKVEPNRICSLSIDMKERSQG